MDGPLIHNSNLVTVLFEAASHPTWTADELRQILSPIESLDELRVEWDIFAGEGWVRVLSGMTIFALVRAPTDAYPAIRFAFVRRESHQGHSIEDNLRRNGAEVHQVDDFDDEMFMISLHDLEVFVDGPLPPAHVFNPSCFSANDLVFVTE